MAQQHQEMQCYNFNSCSNGSPFTKEALNGPGIYKCGTQKKKVTISSISVTEMRVSSFPFKDIILETFPSLTDESLIKS